MVSVSPASYEDACNCTPFKYRTFVRDGKKSAYVFDQNGHGLTLHAHNIAEDGIVTPSCVCPIAGCGFHDWFKLEGWIP